MKSKRNMIISIVVFALSAGFAFASAVYRVEFVKWTNLAITYICYAFTIICTGLTALTLTFANEKYNGKKLKRTLTAVIPGVLVGVSSMATTVIINNVLAHGTENQKAIDTAMFITTAVFFITLIVLSKKKLSRIISGILASAMILGIVFGKGIMEEKKRTSRIPSPAMAEVENWGVREDLTGKADFYISSQGSDDNDGSMEKPFLTFEKARDAVRTLDKTGKERVSVGVFPGEYRTSGIKFTEEDSGTEECPIVYGVCGEGECIINAGVSLNPSNFKNITDNDVLSRLSEDAGKCVKYIDLGECGITAEDYGKIYTIGTSTTAGQYTGDYVGPTYSELFIDDQRQVLARYPNDEYLETEKVISTGYGLETNGSLTRHDDFYDTVNPESDVYGISSKLTKRIASWKTLDDVWMFGYWKYDWADASSPIGEFSEENKTISPLFVSTYGTKTGAPYYFFNVFEELDAAGEWYLDRENGFLYVYPGENFSSSNIDMSLGLDSVFTLDNCSYITLDGFTVKGTRGDGFTITGDSNKVLDCVIKNVSGNAMVIKGYDNLVSECEITRTGKGGIYIDGGDRETLKPGNNIVDNNLIHDWAEVYKTYRPAVSIDGVGNVCSHNEMYNTPHEAITYSGNNHVIEYNRIHDVCLLGDDAGAIYSGRRWDWYGTEIRYNMIYNLGSGEHEPNAIYFDDALSGQSAYGNLIISVPQKAFQIGGGRDIMIKNNLVVNCNGTPFSYDQRAIDGVSGGWFTHSSQKGGDMWTNLEQSPWQNEYWKKAYPQMSKFSDDFNDTDNPDFVPNPSYSEVTGNVTVNWDGYFGFISEKAEKYSTIENNPVYTNKILDELFNDYENGDYTIKDDSPIFKDCPDFEQLPLSEMGRYSPN